MSYNYIISTTRQDRIVDFVTEEQPFEKRKQDKNFSGPKVKTYRSLLWLSGTTTPTHSVRR